MSTLTMGNSRLKLGGKGSNKLRKPKPTKRPKGAKGPSMFTGTGKVLVRMLLGLVFLALLVGLGFSCLYGYRWITAHPYFGIDEIHIAGNQRLTHGIITELADIKPGMNCIDLNVAVIERKIAANPWVESVTVRRQLPDSLWVTVTERQPRFMARQSSGLYYADGEGRIIAPVKPNTFVSLPMLEVEARADDPQQVLPALLKRINDGLTPFGMNETAWVRMLDARQVEIFLDAMALTMRLDVKDWETGLNRIGHVWRDLERRGELSAAKTITATGGKVWVRKRIQG